MDKCVSQWTPEAGQAPREVGWFSAIEAAELLGTSQRTIRRAIAAGRLQATKRSGVYRIGPDELTRFRERSPNGKARSNGAHSLRPILHPELQPGASAFPAPLTTMIGRRNELELLRSTLHRDGVRLLTLTGAGGVGKTRLALRLAEDLTSEFPDDICFVGLEAVQHYWHLLTSIARPLGVAEVAGVSTLEQIRALIHRRQLLIVLDNFEHLLPAAPVVADLLAACPRLTVVVTSREPLRISGERVIVVQPLSLPAAGEPAEQSEAVQLFVERARSFSSEFALTENNSQAVVDICRRLDGLPLAIELAAARIAHINPVELLKRLERRLPLLTGGSRDLPQRQQTVRNTISWSHDQMSLEEQILFRRLAIFVGGLTLDAAEVVAQPEVESSPGDIGPGRTQTVSDSVLNNLASLVAKNMLHKESEPMAGAYQSRTRYRMLETVREFALEQLEATSEEEQIRSRQANYFLALAERANTLQIGPQALDGFSLLERERGNLQAALSWFDANDDYESLMRLVVALSYFWELSGDWTESITWLERALATDFRPTPQRVEALESLALTLEYRGKEEAAEALLCEALDLARRLDATRQIASVLMIQARQRLDRGNFIDAEELLLESVGLAQDAGDLDGEAGALNHLGIAALGRGDLTGAVSRFGQSVNIWQELGATLSVALTERRQALVSAMTGDFAEAVKCFNHHLANVAHSAPVLARVTPDVAVLAALRGEPECAARLFGAGAALAIEIGMAPREPERRIHEQTLAAARTSLGSDLCDRAFEGGRRFSRTQLKAELGAVLDATLADHHASGRGDYPDRFGLTPRELEVLHLLAQRLTDREIADRLFISRRTASKHVTAVLAKLGAPDRRAAAVATTSRRIAAYPEELWPTATRGGNGTRSANVP